MVRFILVFASLLLTNIGLQAQIEKSWEGKEIKDILYVSKSNVQNDTLQRLNLLIPRNVKNAPLLIWIGGGAWSYVNKDMEMDLARQLMREGIAVATVGHRLSTATWKDPALNKGVKHPEHIKDVAAAFKWLYDHAEKLGYNKDQIFVGGYSSGGHLAALLSMDEQYLKTHGLSRSNIKGVIPIAGAYDISHYHQVFATGSRKELAELHVKAVFGNTEEDFAQASPTSYVDNMIVPMLLISESGTYNYTRILEDKIRSSGFEGLEVLHISELDHGGLWKNLSFENTSKHRDKIVSFIRSKEQTSQ